MAIDPKTRATVFYMSKIKHLSTRKIAKECNVSQTTVWRLRRMKMGSSKSHNNQPHVETRGRKRKITQRQERRLRRCLHVLREEEGHFTVKRLMWAANIDMSEVSESTVQRFLHREGYYYLQARKKGLLYKKDLKRRIDFVNKMQNEYGDDVWTKDIAFYLDGTSFAYKRNPLDQARAPKGRVWRKKSEGLDRGCTAKGRKTGTGGRVLKLMVAISFDKGVILCKPYEKLDGHFFAKFIDENFDNMFAKANKGPQRLWMQDGDPSQNSAFARAAMARAHCELIQVPPRSPDTHCIENIFKLVGDRLREQAINFNITNETYEQFQHRVISTIESLPIATINSIIASMPNRLKEIKKRKGQRIRY